MLAVHHTVGTFRNKVHAYIVLSEFAKRIMVRAGLPIQRIHVKPNFVHTDRRTDEDRAKHIAFVGRIAYEKGLDLLLAAWNKSERRDWKLIVIGDGPERGALERQYSSLDNVTWCGWLDKQSVAEQLRRSAFSIIPSRGYEGGFPLAALESMATGTPVLAPDIGAFPEVVRDNNAGVLFTHGSVDALSEALELAFDMNMPTWRAMAGGARRAAIAKYSPRQNYAEIVKIYAEARSVFEGGEGVSS